MFDNSEFVAWANEHVVLLVGHIKGPHRSVDVAKPAKGEPKTQCSLYPGIACEEHEKIFAEATGKGADEPKDAKDGKAAAKPRPKPKPKADDAKPELPKLAVTGFPTSYVILPDGTFEKLAGDREPASCRAALEGHQQKAEEHPIPSAKWPEVKAAWAEAEKAFKASKWRATLEAIAKSEACVEGGLPKAYVERVKEKVDAIDAKAAARLADAKKLKDPAAAAKAVAALKAELDVKLASGPLPVVAQLDEFLGLGSTAKPGEPAADPAKPAEPKPDEPAPSK